MTTIPLPVAQLDAVEALAREAGAIALEHFQRVATIPVAMKGHLDLVTEADQAVERHIVAALRRLFPEDGVLGEEGGQEKSRTGRIWIVDPIDGTSNFVRGSDQWAVSIGLFEAGRPVYGVIHAPVRRQTFRGGLGLPATLNGAPLQAAPPLDRARALVGVSLHPAISVETRLKAVQYIIAELRMDFRCCGASTIALMDMALGLADGHLAYGIASWDVAAALPILASLGFADTLDWAATPLDEKIHFACGTPEFLTLMAPLLASVKG